MRKKIFAISITLILLSTYISVEANSGNNFILENNSCGISPIVNNSKLSIPSNKNIKEMVNSAPMAFTENRGQLNNDEVRFYDQRGNVWFTDDGVWFEVREELSINSPQSTVRSPESRHTTDDWRPETKDYKRLILKQEFVGANHVRPVGRNRLSWNSNFFYGNDSSKWCTDVPNYAEVYFENLYDGIDLKYYTNINGLKYDFILHPGADIKQIRFRFEGADGIKIDKFENLVVRTSVEDIIDGDLFIYQDYNEVQRQVNGQFKIYNNSEYGFELLDEYDKNKILVIDPHISLKYSTFIGGSFFDESFHIDVDSEGNAFVTGWTNSSNFPNTPGAYDNLFEGSRDGFIYKLSSDGSELIYSTFIGGTDFDYGGGIVIDSNGSAVITGLTQSSDFPTTPGAYDRIFNATPNADDCFVLKLNQDGSNLVFSTFIGGSQGEWGEDIDIDSNGNLYVGGHTSSLDFPDTIGAFDQSYTGSGDSFLLKFNHNCSKLIYSTFIGGSADDYVRAIEVDSAGCVFAVGQTLSSDFPVTPGAFNTTHNSGFVLKLNSAGSDLIYSTFVGGSTGWDSATDVAIDVDGFAYIVGVAYSHDFPTTAGAYDTSFNGGIYDIFVTKLNQNGSALNYSTFIGGKNWDLYNGIAVDPEGNVIISGYTNSTDFPITPDAYCKSKNGMYDVFISRLNANGSELLYSTFLGGTGHEYGFYFGFDLKNNVYMTGSTNSSDFPTTPGAFDTTHNGDYDGFVIKLAMPPLVIITSVSLLKNNESTNITYSKLCPYTLRTKITDNPGLGELKRVRLSLDTLGSNIQLIWNRTTDKFLKINDPNNFIILEPSSSAYVVSLNGWVIDFNITFNWTYPDEVFHNVQVFASSATLSPAWFNVTNLYRLENDLVFNGTLSVKGGDNRNITENDLIRGGEKLNWTGLKSVYEGTTDIYPPTGEFDITIWNEANTSNSWSDSPAWGKNFTIQANADSNTDLDGNLHIINLSGIPPECDATNETFTIRIDGDNVTFSNPIPDIDIWQTTSNIEVSIDITDIGGGFVNGSSVKYCFSTDNGTNWSEWIEFPKLKSGVSVNPKDVVFFPEGKNNFVKWQAGDSVGNGPVENEGYRILVDSEELLFSNGYPTEKNESPTENVEVGITISDVTSGVDASIVEYAISTNNGANWGMWVPITGIKDGNEINIKMDITFPNGTDNRIKWRASDVAGNGPKESEEYIIKVNRWLPTPRVNLWSPKNGSIIRTDSVELSWMLEDWKLHNVIYDVYLDKVNPPVLINQSSVIKASLIIDDLINGKTYFWTVIPKIGLRNGTCDSGVWSFTVNLPSPSVTLISPANGSTITSRTPTLMWSLEYEGAEIVKYEIYFENNMEPKLLHNGYPNTYFSPQTILEYNTTYYWQIVPNASGIKGPPSELWSFTIGREDYLPNFELNITLEPAIIELVPDEKKYVKAIVTNLGNLTDSISLRIWVPPDTRVGAMVNEPNMIEASPKGIAEFNIMVIAFEDAEQNEISLRVVAISETAPEYNLTAVKETTLILKIKIVDMDTEKHEKDNSSSLEGNWHIFFIVIIIIFILIILAIIILRKKSNDNELISAEVVTAKSEDILVPEIVTEQVPTTTSAPLDTITPPAIDTPQLTVSTTNTPVPVPKLVRSTETAQTAPTAQAPAQLLQLPPAILQQETSLQTPGTIELQQEEITQLVQPEVALTPTNITNQTATNQPKQNTGSTTTSAYSQSPREVPALIPPTVKTPVQLVQQQPPVATPKLVKRNSQ